MEVARPQKSAIIFASLLFVAIVTGTIFTTRQLSARNRQTVLETPTPSPLTSATPSPTPEVLPTDTPVLIDTSTLPPLPKPSINRPRGEDHGDDD